MNDMHYRTHPSIVHYTIECQAACVLFSEKFWYLFFCCSMAEWLCHVTSCSRILCCLDQSHTRDWIVQFWWRAAVCFWGLQFQEAQKCLHQMSHRQTFGLNNINDISVQWIVCEYVGWGNMEMHFNSNKNGFSSQFIFHLIKLDERDDRNRLNSNDIATGSWRSASFCALSHIHTKHHALNSIAS